MPNIIKYTNVENDAGERVATNGYYTGHKKGTPTQAQGEASAPYGVEENTVRYGTMLGDAIPGSMPTVVSD